MVSAEDSVPSLVPPLATLASRCTLYGYSAATRPSRCTLPMAVTAIFGRRVPRQAPPFFYWTTTATSPPFRYDHTKVVLHRRAGPSPGGVIRPLVTLRHRRMFNYDPDPFKLGSWQALQQMSR